MQSIARRASVETEEGSFAFLGPLGCPWSSRSGRATAPLKIVTQHLQAVATMPARSTERNQIALPFNFGQGQEADMQILRGFPGREKPLQSLFHRRFHLAPILASVNYRL